MTAIEGLSAVYYDKAALANLKAATAFTFWEPQTKSEKFLDDCREAIGEKRKRPTPTAVSYKIKFTSVLPPSSTIRIRRISAPTARRRSKKTTAS